MLHYSLQNRNFTKGEKACNIFIRSNANKITAVNICQEQSIKKQDHCKNQWVVIFLKII